MKLETIPTPGLAHLSYLLSSEGDALVVDPRRDVEVYLDRLRAEGLRLRFVLETHCHEDFVLGSAELSRRTGAERIRLSEREVLDLGSLRLLAFSTPGHTPESVSYVVYTQEQPSLAWAVFTGDALFSGATGRTDLEDPGRTGENAGRLYDALHQHLLPLEDQALVLPAHGPGSPCGSKISDRAPTTLGFERRSNPVFTEDRETFVRRKLLERIPRPPYFERMRALNQRGGAPLPDVDAVPIFPPKAFQAECAQGLVIDTREPEAFAGGHLSGAYSIWLGGLSPFAGWVAHEETPVFLVLEQGTDPREAAVSLARVGLEVRGILADGIAGWRREGLPMNHSGTLTPAEVAEDFDRWQRLDVREISEFEQGHIPGIEHVYVGELEDHVARLGFRRDLPVFVTCSSGYRSGLATSMLLRHGFPDVYNLLGGMTAWTKRGLPTETERPQEAAEGPLTATVEERTHPE